MASAETAFFAQVLKQELTRRCRKNPSYSLRSFAKSIDASPAYLSRVLSGQRIPSAKMAAKIADSLCLSGGERRKFLASIVTKRAQTDLAAADSEGNRDQTEPWQSLDDELYDVIGDLNHFAILELLNVEGFDADPRWIARHLGITVLEAKLAIDRLLYTGLLKNEGGILTATNRSTVPKDKLRTSAARRRTQKQILEKALDSLQQDPYEARSMTGMTMAIDPEKMPLARELIQTFMEDLSEVLGARKQTCVYQLGISLFPLQKRRGATCQK